MLKKYTYTDYRGCERGTYLAHGLCQNSVISDFHTRRLFLIKLFISQKPFQLSTLIKHRIRRQFSTVNMRDSYAARNKNILPVIHGRNPWRNRNMEKYCLHFYLLFVKARKNSFKRNAANYVCMGRFNVLKWAFCLLPKGGYFDFHVTN